MILVGGSLVQWHEPIAGVSSLHQLPGPVELVGRETELAELEVALSEREALGATILGKHACLQGMGGVGKTALAVVLAHRLRDRYPDAQLFVNLRGADPGGRQALSAQEAMEGVIHAFRPETRLPDDVDKLGGIYRSVLAGAGKVLLVLDNAAGEEQVRPMQPPPNCLLLVTSRQQFELPGMVVRNVDCLMPVKSRELLLKLAPGLGAYADEVASLCGHLPLALEVFAGTVNAKKKVYGVAELVERLRERKEKLGPVEAAFEVSYGLLTEDQQRRWRLLSVFPASFDVWAASAVLEGEVEADGEREALLELVNGSLLERNESNGRLRQHDLVRRFCEGKLSEGERSAARKRHARHYAKVGEEAHGLYLKGGEWVEQGLGLFDRERVNVEWAFEWLGSQSERELLGLLVSLVDAIVFAVVLRFHPRQRIRWLEAQRKAAVRVGDRRGEGNAVGNLGNAYFALGDARKAIEQHEQALAIAREIGDRRGEGNAVGNLGLAYADLGDARKAIELYEEVLVIAREIGDRRGEGNTLGNLGVAYAALGDVRKAIEQHEQALVIAREIGDRRGEGNAAGNLGNAYFALGDARKAIELYEERLVIARGIGDRRGEGNAVGNLGNAYAALGDVGKAIEQYEEQLNIVREIGDRRGEGIALWNLAIAQESVCGLEAAIAAGEGALRIFEAIESPNAEPVRAGLASWRSQPD